MNPLSSFITNYKVFLEQDEGCWNLMIDTGSSVNPMGSRFGFGGVPPEFKWEFTDKAEGLKACMEWEAYFKEVAKRKK